MKKKRELLVAVSALVLATSLGVFTILSSNRLNDLDRFESVSATNYQIKNFSATAGSYDEDNGSMPLTFSGLTSVYNRPFVSESSHIDAYGILEASYPTQSDNWLIKITDTEQYSVFEGFEIYFMFEAAGAPIDGECKVSYRTYDYNGVASAYKIAYFEIDGEDGLYMLSAYAYNLTNTYTVEISSIDIKYSCQP